MKRRQIKWVLLAAAALLSTLAPAADLAQHKAAHLAAMAALEKGFGQQVAELNRGYLQALAKIETKFRAEGELDEVLALRAEMERIKTEPERGAGSGSPVPELAELQEKYTSTLEGYARDLDAQGATAISAHIDRLLELQVALTKQEKLDDALAVRAEIQALKNPRRPAVAAPVSPPTVTPPRVTSRPGPAPLRPSPGPLRPGGTRTPAGGTGLPAGYTLYFPFDVREDDGRVLDRSPSGMHGESDSNQWIATGKRGGGFDFTGRDSIKLADNAGLHPESFTIAVWVNLKAPSSYGRIWDKYEHARRSGYGFQINAFRPVLELWDEERKKHVLTTDQALSVGEWNHVAVVFSPGRGALFINGELAKSEPMPDSIRPNDSPVHIGLDEYRPLRGHLDELVFYPRALSASEIAAVLAATEK